MRASRALAVAATACAAVLLSTPLAGASEGPGTNGPANTGFTANGSADNDSRDHEGRGNEGRDNEGRDNGPRNVRVSPFAVHQGGTLRITFEGCRQGGTIDSNAFRQVRFPANREGRTSVSARIRDNATPGRYNLVVRCNGNPRIETHQFEVLPGRGAQGGLGGSVGPSSTEMGIGAGLVASAAVGGSMFLARRRRASAGQI